MRLRIVTARANGGYLGYVVQRRGWLFWNGVNNHVYRTFSEAVTAMKNFAVPVGDVIYEVTI